MEDALEDIKYYYESFHPVAINILSEDEFDKQFKRNIGKLAKDLFHSLYPLIPFILLNMPEIPDNISLIDLKIYQELYFLTFFIGINEIYEGMTLQNAFSKEFKRCLLKKKLNKDKKILRNLKVSEQQYGGHDNNKKDICVKALSECIKYFKYNATLKQLEIKVQSGDIENIRDFFKYAKNRKHINKACIIHCMNVLTNWITYYLFIKNREEKEETDETPSDGYYSSHSKRKKYIFREEYFDYTGIALKHLSIELFPNIGDGTLFTRFTNNFWYEAEQLKEMVAKVIWKLDNVQPYSYDIYNKIYNRLASEEEMDWGRKKDLCKFFELAYITYN